MAADNIVAHVFSSQRWSFAVQCLTGVAVASCAMRMQRANLLPKRNFCFVPNNKGRFKGLSLLLSLMEEDFNKGRLTQGGDRLGQVEQRHAKIN